MQIYNYHPVTKEFICTSQARSDPEEIGKFLIPAHSTVIEPPIYSDSECAIFNEVDNNWTKVADYRGKKFWKKFDKTMYVIEELGETPDDTMTLIEPKPNEKWDGSGWVVDEQAELEFKRMKRNDLLNECDKYVLRHLEQLELVKLGLMESSRVKLSDAEYQQLLIYKQKLRDMEVLERLEF